MRSFAIIGLSTFGTYLAKFLAELGHSVATIDKDEERTERIKAYVDRAIIADATDKDTLKGLGLEELDTVVVSLGDQIDASVLVTLYLREIHAKEIIAKASSEDHGRVLNIIGANRIVYPERDEALRLAKTLESDYLIDSIPLGDNLSVIETATPISFLGKSIGDLDLRRKYGVLVVAVKELVPQKTIMIPNADQVLKDSDILLILGTDEDLLKIKKLK